MARKSKKAAASGAVEAVVHKSDRRANIPTRELADFVVKEEEAPYNRLYPRDPSLDPQLVWKGKDEQDRQDLAVPTVPIYIQEKIAPQAIIENFRLEQKKEVSEPQARLFADFNGIEFEKLIEFYQHEQNWSNRMILGDSLLVMNSLAEKEGLRGKVQMIYIDPPYGIKFGSNWQVSTRKREVKDGKAEDVNREPEVIKAYRDTWEMGIHSYLTYLRDRFAVGHQLLSEGGSIFVQIGDENVHLVRLLLDEVFDSKNFVSLIVFQKAGSTTSELLSNPVDYILWYSKSRDQVKFRPLYLPKEQGGVGASKYTSVELPDGRRVPISELPDDVDRSRCRVFRLDAITSQGYRANTSVPFRFRGLSYDTGTTKNWKTTLEGMSRLALARKN